MAKSAAEQGVSRKDIYRIPIELIDAYDEENCRINEEMDPAKLQSLAANMLKEGQHTPVLVRGEGDRYRLVAGFRRLAAARLADIKTLEAKLYREGPEFAQITNLSENLQREDLSPIEIARGLKLSLNKGVTIPELADRLGRPELWVEQYLNYLDLSKKEQELLKTRALSPSAAIELVHLKEEDVIPILEMAKKFSVGGGLTKHGIQRAKQKQAKKTGGTAKLVAPTKKELKQFLETLRRNESSESQFAANVLAWALGEREAQPRPPSKGLLVAAQ